MKVGNLSTLSTETEAIIIDRTQISFLIQIPTRRVIFDYELARLSFPLVTAQPTSLTVAVPQRFFFLEMVSQFFQHFELSVNLFSCLLINYTIESCTRAYIGSRISDLTRFSSFATMIRVALVSPILHHLYLRPLVSVDIGMLSEEGKQRRC